MIRHTHENELLRITLDDSGLNVLTLEAVAKLRSLLRAAEASPQTQVVIIRGNARALSVGLDSKTVLKGDECAQQLLQAMRDALNTLYLGSLKSIVVCQGHATAAGAMLLLASDYRIGVLSTGKVGLSEVSIGLPVPNATIQLLRDRIAPQEIYSCAALSTLYGYRKAAAIGFFDQVAESDVEAETIETAIVEHLLSLPQHAYLETKRHMRSAFSLISNNR